MLPAGTVTFLFSDIEGSTAILRDIGTERYESALRLAGAAAAEFDALAIDISGIIFWSALQERYLGGARSELGAEVAAAAREEGRRTPFDRAIALALGE